MVMVKGAVKEIVEMLMAIQKSLTEINEVMCEHDCRISSIERYLGAEYLVHSVTEQK